MAEPFSIEAARYETPIPALYGALHITGHTETGQVRWTLSPSGWEYHNAMSVTEQQAYMISIRTALNNSLTGLGRAGIELYLAAAPTWNSTFDVLLARCVKDVADIEYLHKTGWKSSAV